MSLTRRFTLLVVVGAALLSIGAAQASATNTVTVIPGGGVTATASSTAFIRVGGLTIAFRACTMTGTWANNAGVLPLPFSPPVPVAAVVDNTKGNLDIRCTGCTVAGIACTMTCDGRANVLATALTRGGLTALRITGIRCTIRLATGCTAVFAGPVPNDGGVAATYDNAFSTLTIDAPNGVNQSLAISASTCPAVIPNGAATLSGPANGPIKFTVVPFTTVTVT